MCSAYKRCSLLAILLVIALYSPALKAAPSDQVHGSLVVTIADYFAENRSETRYFIKDQSQPGRTYELLFAATPRGDLRTGMVVTGSKPLNAFYTFRIGAGYSAELGGILKRPDHAFADCRAAARSLLT